MKLTRVTLLDHTKRPKAPKIDNLSPAQIRQGRRLSLYHNHHRAQLREVEAAMVHIDDALLAKISDLDMRHNFASFGNMCGAECQMLNYHHDAEEHMMFPVLHEQGSDGLKKVVERLVAEHVVVHALIAEMETSAHAAVANPTPENFEKLKSVFTDLNTCVQSHFVYEETELAGALGVIDVGI